MLLDDIIGIPSGWQGTLDPIGILRSEVCICWATLLKDHGLCMSAYNTLEEVNEGLRKYWRTKMGKDHYKKLKVLYPKAEADFAEYYRKAFGKSKKEAQKMAKSFNKTFRIFKAKGLTF